MEENGEEDDEGANLINNYSQFLHTTFLVEQSSDVAENRSVIKPPQ